MLLLFIRKHSRIISPLLLRLQAPITTDKILALKKKMVYQSQLAPKSTIDGVNHLMTPEEQQKRQDRFMEMLLQLGKDLSNYFQLRIGLTKQTVNFSPILIRHQSKILKQTPTLTALQLLNYIQIVKNLCLQKLQYTQTIQWAYKQLQKLIQTSIHKRIIANHFTNLWKDNNILIQIRSICLIQYMPQSTRQQYFKRIVPFVKYFKSVDMMILMYEKYRFKYEYSYQLLDQVHNNQYYMLVDQINQCFIKMLFFQSFRGQFSPHQDGIFNPILTHFKEKPNALAQAAFDKFVRIIHVQGSIVQTQVTRMNMEHSLNTFINIAKSQQYDSTSIKLQQIIDIYLGFEQTNSTGQILLNEITFLAKKQNVVITSQSFPLYQKLLMSVLNNIEKKLKYERRDYLNKEYTHDTVFFLQEFLPKYIPLWPEVIFQVNQAHQQLFSKHQENCSLLKTFQNTFKTIILQRKHELTLQNSEFVLKVVKFVQTTKQKQIFTLQLPIYQQILQQFINKEDKYPTNQQLQILHLILIILGKQMTQKASLRQSIITIKVMIQNQMKKQLSKSQNQSQIISRDENIIWLALCHAQIYSQDFPIDYSIAEIFVNNELYFMLNSLKYKEVYTILVYTLNLSRLSSKIYQKLLNNLSTFIIFISQQTEQAQSKSPFYLNHQYSHLFNPIVNLVLTNYNIFRKVKNKNAFKLIQLLIIKNSHLYSNNNILTFLNILEDPAYLIPSMKRFLNTLSFKTSQLENIEDSNELKLFSYYNQSLIRYFEGNYNQGEIRYLLKSRTLSQADIKEYFSEVEVYQTIISDGSLNFRFDIPPPQTIIPDFKCMYICQKIFQKIQKQNNFILQQFSDPSKVDLDDEISYIKKQGLIVQNFDNQFRISQRTLPKYIKVQVWKNFTFFDKEFQIEPKDLFHKLADEILIKVIKGVLGKFQKIKEVVKDLQENEDIISQLRQRHFKFQENGAAIEFKKKNDDKLTIFCTNNTNYKILYICAYCYALNGHRVMVLKDNQSLSSLFRLLEKQNLKEQEQQQEEVYNFRGQEEEDMEL